MANNMQQSQIAFIKEIKNKVDDEYQWEGGKGWQKLK